VNEPNAFVLGLNTCTRMTSQAGVTALAETQKVIGDLVRC